ncbi:YceI family protein [Marinoscillum pacificum]|uniref:YceI family protein n=1 Tax=Marinoscillum pacificum TaxID=392723 RepID=UPI002157A089|nr:YceI family protein [Marinoscillum pacificum]
MKKLGILCLGTVLLTAACTTSPKESSSAQEETTEVASTDNSYAIVAGSAKANFTAYKTTDKLPVGGTFKTINITKSGEGETALKALDGTEFSIPVSSLFTNDATGTRDPKILEFFFGVMTDTENITGTFKLGENDSSSIEVKLNGVTASIPLTYEVSGDEYTFKGVMELENWSALDAVASINKACEALHTGSDGVSKTWSEVAVEAIVTVSKK